MATEEEVEGLEVGIDYLPAGGQHGLHQGGSERVPWELKWDSELDQEPEGPQEFFRVVVVDVNGGNEEHGPVASIPDRRSEFAVSDNVGVFTIWKERPPILSR